ncbi:MAG: Holliday junction branch migration protein RuvA [bacterium]|nr:Holliday junction branch migration protein RuvA [bacterium]
MIHQLTGTLAGRGETFAVVSCGGVGYKVFAGGKTLAGLPMTGAEVTLYTHLAVKEDALDLYGFPDEQSLKLFDLLISVSGVGPKTALGILDLDTVPNIQAAILERRTDLLARASGIGKRTAERIVLELQSRVALVGAMERTKSMDVNLEVEEALVMLGYQRAEARHAIEQLGSADPDGAVGAGGTTTEARLKEALKMLGRK